MYLESLVQISPESYSAFTQIEAQQMTMVADYITKRLEEDNPFLMTAVKSGVRSILEAAERGDQEEIAACARVAIFTVLRLVEREAQAETEEGQGIRDIMEQMQGQKKPAVAGEQPKPKPAPRKTRFSK